MEKQIKSKQYYKILLYVTLNKVRIFALNKVRTFYKNLSETTVNKGFTENVNALLVVY